MSTTGVSVFPVFKRPVSEPGPLGEWGATPPGRVSGQQPTAVGATPPGRVSGQQPTAVRKATATAKAVSSEPEARGVSGLNTCIL